MKKKGIFCLIFALLLTCQLCTPAIAQENLNYEQGLEVLLASGWSIEDIEYFFQPEDVEKFAQFLPAISTSKKYFCVTDCNTVEVSEAEAFTALQSYQMSQNSNVALASIGDSSVSNNGYLKYELSVYPQTTGTSYMLHLSFNWLIIPPQRFTDVVGLGYSGNLTRTGTSSSITTRYYATISEFDGVNTTVYTHNVSPSAYSSSNGAAFKFSIVRDTVSEMYSRTASNHRGFIQFLVAPNDSSATLASAHGAYAHQHLSYTGSISISFDGTGGLSVTPTTKYTMLIPNPYCSFSV